MTDQDKRCGTCRWWQPWGTTGECMWNGNVPACIVPRDNWFLMNEADGTGCPCWEPKDATELPEPPK